MRIAHVNGDPGVRPGAAKGAWVHVESMRQAFLSQGMEVVALDEPDPDALADRLEPDLGLIYERFSLRNDAAARHAAAHGIPYVLEVNAPLDEEERRHRPERARDLDPQALRRQLAGAQVVLCVSEAVAGWARDRGADPGSILVLGNAVDLERFHPGLRAEGVRESLGLTDRFVIGFHGRLRPWHGFEGLVHVTARLIERGLPLHLLAVGHGDYEEVLAAGLPAEHYHHVPWVDHATVGHHVAAFDLMALGARRDLPYYFSPLKLLEAMACEVPVIAPDLGDLRETLGAEACHFYPAGDLEALSNAILDLYLSPARALQLGRAGAAVAARHTWSDVAGHVLARLGVVVR